MHVLHHRSLVRALVVAGLAAGALACAAWLVRRRRIASMRLEGGLRRPPTLPGTVASPGLATERRRLRPYQADPLAAPQPPAVDGPRWNREAGRS